MEDVRTRFGLDKPPGGMMGVGGNFRFGTGGSDIWSAIGDGEIRTVGHGFLKTARRLADEDLHADGRL